MISFPVMRDRLEIAGYTALVLIAALACKSGKSQSTEADEKWPVAMRMSSGTKTTLMPNKTPGATAVLAAASQSDLDRLLKGAALIENDTLTGDALKRACSCPPGTSVTIAAIHLDGWSYEATLNGACTAPVGQRPCLGRRVFVAYDNVKPL